MGKIKKKCRKIGRDKSIGVGLLIFSCFKEFCFAVKCYNCRDSETIFFRT